MKIGIEAQRLFRRKKHGMEIVALETIRELQKQDHSNQYTLFIKKDEDENCIEETNNFSIKKIESRFYPFWEQISLPKAIKNYQLDLLHCTANTAPLFCKTPMIITVHDVIYLESINFSGSAYQNFGNLYRLLIVPRVVKKAELIITVSEFEKENISKRLRVPENKVRVVHNGVNPLFRHIINQDELNTFRLKYTLPEKYILHIGNTEPRKNTLGVLKAYQLYQQKFKHALPLVISNCKADYIASLLKQINAETLISNIQVLGYLPFTDIPYLYNQAYIFLYPSFREGFGMPVAESMACGTPVITSNTSSLPEVAGDAAILINPGSIDEIFNAILHLTEDEGLYSQKKKAGFENAKRFSWQKVAEKTITIYNELKK